MTMMLSIIGEEMLKKMPRYHKLNLDDTTISREVKNDKER